MGIYSSRVDPFARPKPSTDVVTVPNAVLEEEPIEWAHMAPVLAEGTRLPAEGQVPEEYRWLFTHEALALLEPQDQRPPATPSVLTDPGISHYLCERLFAALSRGGRIPANRLAQLATTWPHDLTGIVADGYTLAQVGDLVEWVCVDARTRNTVTGMQSLRDTADHITGMPRFRAWAMNTQHPNWEFSVKSTRALDTLTLAAINPEVVALCVRLREQVQHNTETYIHTRTAATLIQITDKWLIDADRILRLDGYTYDQVAEVIEWATTDSFWRTNIRSLPKLRQQLPRLIDDARFHRWREETGRVTWSDDVHALCESMVKFLNFAFPGAAHKVSPAWFRGADDLLTRYSLLDVKDMMAWSLTDRWALSNVHSLLTSKAVQERIRNNWAFIAWAQTQGRPWALATVIPEDQNRRR